MKQKTTEATIIAMPGSRLTIVEPELDRVAGDALTTVTNGTDSVSDPSESWLDSLADALSEKAWMELDLSGQLAPGLLEALSHEVAILHSTEAMRRAGIGRGSELIKDRSVRRDRIAWLEGCSEAQAGLFRFLDQLMAGLNRRLFLGLRRYEAHYATYEPGDFYKRHLDSFHGRASRMISLVLYLNDDWTLEDGGELRVFSPDNEHCVAGLVRPQSGKAALFLSEEVPHEVLPANRTRFSIACWFRQDEVPLPL